MPVVLIVYVISFIWYLCLSISAAAKSDGTFIYQFAAWLVVFIIPYGILAVILAALQEIGLVILTICTIWFCFLF